MSRKIKAFYTDDKGRKRPITERKSSRSIRIKKGGVNITLDGIPLTVTGRYVGEVDHFPNTDDNMYHNKFIITVRSGNGEKITFPFYDSYQNYLEGKTTLSKQDLLYSLRALFDDATLGDMSFDDFCGETGYDCYDDRARARRVYKACQNALRKVKKLGIDPYNALNELSRRGIE